MYKQTQPFRVVAEKEDVMITEAIKPKTKAEEIVLSFLDALNNFDYQKARSFVTDDLTFYGVLGSRAGADVYFKDMERIRLQYDVKKIFSDNTDVCVIYDIIMNGRPIYSCGWYQLDDTKIKTFKVVFDPRPLLEQN